MYQLKLGGLYIEITSVCNRKCPYCYNDSTEVGKILNQELLFRIFEECHRLGITSISLSGGEPFLHPNIYEILSKIEELQMRATIVTNLSPLPIEKAVEIAKRGHKLQLTLDHPEEEINDLTRGKGSYRLVIDLLERFRQEELTRRVAFRYNVSKCNYERIEEVIKLAIYYGIKQMDVALLFKSGRGCSYEEVFDYTKDLLQLGKIVAYCKTLKEYYAKEIDLGYTTLDTQLGCVLFGDGELSIGPKIEPNGDVYVCQLFSGKENVLGNIKESSLEEILSSVTAHHVVDRVRDRKQKQKDCTGCGFNDVCMCGCPAVSYNQTGNLFDKNDQCSMIKFFLKERIKQIGVSV